MTVRLLLILLLPALGFAQDTTTALSKYENFLTPTGRMYKTEKGRIGEIRDIKFDLNKVTDLQTKDSLKSISVTQIKSALLTPYTFGAIYIDLEDLPGLVDALNFFMEEIQKGKPKWQPAYSYVTPNDVELSCGYYEGGFLTGWYVSIAKRYHYLKTTIPNSSISVKNKDIDDFVQLLNTAKTASFK